MSQLKHHVQCTITIETTLGSSGSVPYGSKGGLNRVAGSYYSANVWQENHKRPVLFTIF
ncbi:uncharacterized protein METZ01_LOCUS504763, partial [marine metagenome]